VNILFGAGIINSEQDSPNPALNQEVIHTSRTELTVRKSWKQVIIPAQKLSRMFDSLLVSKPGWESSLSSGVDSESPDDRYSHPRLWTGIHGRKDGKHSAQHDQQLSTHPGCGPRRETLQHSWHSGM